MENREHNRPFEIEYIKCPVCEHTNQIHFLRKDNWNIVRCTSCTLAMVNPRRRNCSEIYEDDAYFKDENYYYDYEGNKAAYQKGFRSKLKLITRYCPNKGRLLDVGAAYGFFMEEARKYGFDAYGVELSKTAADHASRYGEVFHGSLLEMDVKCRFSVVTFIDSLEHFDDPIAGLKKTYDLLEDQGLVAIMVPNIDSMFARIMKAKWHLLLPEEHLFYFNPTSTKIMLQKTGFEIIHLGTGGYGRSLAELLHVIFRGKWIPPWIIEKFLRKITLEINIGDIFAIARKVRSSKNIISE